RIGYPPYIHKGTTATSNRSIYIEEYSLIVVIRLYGKSTITDSYFPKKKNSKMVSQSVNIRTNLELQYQHEYSGISTSIGLTANPVVNFSGVVGTPLLALGANLSYDTASGNLTKCNAGVSFANADLIAAVTLNDKGQNLNASYYHTVSPLTNTANTLTIGTQKALDPLTSIKARINNHGKASALIQHEWRPKSLFTVSGEVDTRAIEKSAKVGLSVALKP
ncbi:hypothetical protein MKX03_013365, partial [Papaver bracteatum]